ncbi:MAG: sensor histidine kinase, partial [Aggregatilineales bacterium]
FEEQSSVANQLKTLLESTENPILATDRDLKLIFANPAARSLFELDTTTWGNNQRITSILPDDILPNGYLSVMRDIRRKRVHSYEVSLGDQVFMCDVASLGSHRRVEGWVAILNDVTRLKELDRIKSEMIRLTSHDLKNPLQIAFFNLDLLRDGLEDSDTEEIEISVEKIEKQLTRMHRIITGILDLERLRSGVKSDELCSPYEITQSVVSELEILASDKGLHLEVNCSDDLDNFRGDYRQFERALVNLVENAIKFTLPPGTVSLDVTQKYEKLIFKIQDTGIGMPDAIQSRIFDRFYRGNQSGAEHISGSGLGLSLVKTVIESHDGTITVHSQPEVGSTFKVTIPIVKQEMEA